MPAGAHDLKTIAAEADVDLIVTGTLLSAGDEIRVTAQLTDAANGTLVCSHSTQTSIGNVFRLQDELTECMVDALSLQLTRSRTANPQAGRPFQREGVRVLFARQSI